MKQKGFLKLSMLSIVIISVLTLCNAQTISKTNEKNKNMKQESENTLLVLNQNKDYTTHLIAVDTLSEYNKEYVTFIGNGDYFLTYDTETKTTDKKNDIITRKRMTLHVIPESKDRFRLEVRLGSSTFYENGENVGHAKPSGKWNFVGYSDDENNEVAEVLKYFNEHINR